MMMSCCFCGVEVHLEDSADVAACHPCLLARTLPRSGAGLIDFLGAEYEVLVSDHYPDTMTPKVIARMRELETYFAIETLTNISDKHAFRGLLLALHAEMLDEDEDPAAEARADALRDQMDPVWWRLTEEERTEMRAYSAELYGTEAPSLDPMDRPLVFVPPVVCSGSGCSRIFTAGGPFPTTARRMIADAKTLGWSATQNPTCGTRVRFTCGECL